MNALILDNGSYLTKVCQVGQKQISTYPTVLGSTISDKTRRFFGDEAKNIESLNLVWPVKDGLIQRKESIEEFWEFLQQQLKVNFKWTSILITQVPQISQMESEQPQNRIDEGYIRSRTPLTQVQQFQSKQPLTQRARVAELLFEKFNTPSLYFELPAVLALFASGRTTGTSLDSGHDISYCCSVLEGQLIKGSITQDIFGGSSINRYLSDHLEFSYKFSEANTQDILSHFKEKQCFVAFDYQEKCKQNKTDRYLVMPDGSKLQVNNLPFEAPEILFQPKLFHASHNNLQNLSQPTQRIVSYHQNERQDNIVCSGGNLLFENMHKRLTQEIFLRSPLAHQTTVNMLNDPQKAACLGGTILAQLNEFQQSWITKKQYDEIGQDSLNRVCF